MRRDPGHRNSAAAAEFHQSLIPQRPQRPENRVGVDSEHGGEVLCWRKPFTRSRFALSDRPADSRSDLLMQRHRARVVNPQYAVSATHIVIITPGGASNGVRSRVGRLTRRQRMKLRVSSGSGNPPARVARAAMTTGLPGPKAPPLALVGWFSESFRERRSVVSRASATDFSDVERCTAVVRRRTVTALVGQLRTKQIIYGK